MTRALPGPTYSPPPRAHALFILTVDADISRVESCRSAIPPPSLALLPKIVVAVNARRAEPHAKMQPPAPREDSVLSPNALLPSQLVPPSSVSRVPAERVPVALCFFTPQPISGF